MSITIRPVQLALLGLFVLPMAAPAAIADETTAAIEALHQRAIEKKDLWTLLQLEDWARKTSPELELAAFGRHASVFGDLRFAFPAEIEAFWHRGERVVVCTRGYCYVLDEGGRPLRTAIELPFGADRRRLSSDGRYLALADLYGNSSRPKARIAIIDLDRQNEKPILQTEIELDEIKEPRVRYQWDGPLCVAEDGSVAAGAIRRGNWTCGVVLRQGAQGTELACLDDLENLQAIGPGATWLIADLPRDRRQHHLIIGGEVSRQIPRNWAHRHGRVLFRENDRFYQIAPDGEVSEWDPPFAVGQGGGAFITTGPYLVIDGGRFDGSLVDPGDFMGLPPDARQSVAWTYVIDGRRWGADPASEISYRFESQRLELANGQREALLGHQGSDLLIHRLTAQRVETEIITRFDQRIRRSDNSGIGYRVQLDNGDWAVVDSGGGIRWQGPADDCWMHSWNWAVIRRDGVYHAIRLDLEAEHRREIPLQLPEGVWRVDIDEDGGYAVGQQPFRWAQVKLADGSLKEEQVGNKLEGLPSRPPHTSSPPSRQNGRFYQYSHYHARLIDCATPPRELPPDRRWYLNDAFHAGRTTLLLTNRGECFRHDDGVYELVGQHPEARAFATDQNSRSLYLANDDLKDLLLAFNNSLSETREVDRRAAPRELTNAGWGIRTKPHTFYFVPGGRGKQWRWNKNVGLSTQRIRGSKDGLLLVLPSAAILFDMSALKELAAPFEP